MTPAEPTLAALPNPVLRYFLATRPPFLSVSLFAALIGVATAYFDHVQLAPATATLSVVFALVAHAAPGLLDQQLQQLGKHQRGAPGVGIGQCGAPHAAHVQVIVMTAVQVQPRLEFTQAARATVQAARLPRDARVEIECIAAIQ